MMITGPVVTKPVVIPEHTEDRLDLAAYWNLDFDGTPLMSGLAEDGRTPLITDEDDLTLLYARVAFPTLGSAQAQFRLEQDALRERQRHKPRRRPVRGRRPEPAPDVPDDRCTASSWGGQNHQPYGPGGYNRCIFTADSPHPNDEHHDEFGNVFTFNPDAAGGQRDPRVRVLRHHVPARAEDGS